MGQAPDADGVCTTSETTTDMSNLGESQVLGKDVTDLIHGGSPAESVVQVVEYLDSVSSIILLEIGPDLLTQSPSLRHQATTVVVA